MEVGQAALEDGDELAGASERPPKRSGVWNKFDDAAAAGIFAAARAAGATGAGIRYGDVQYKVWFKHTAVRAGRGSVIPRIIISADCCFFPTSKRGGLRDVAPGPRDIDGERQEACEARQEGTTYGECLTHTPP